ncbi:hypothetical protein NFI96_013831, partial [Prochilodus magdalenae]
MFNSLNIMKGFPSEGIAAECTPVVGRQNMYQSAYPPQSKENSGIEEEQQNASVQAIAAVAYLKVLDSSGQYHSGFVLGKAKLAPCPELTIPRLELCAAVLAVDVAELITTEIDMDLDAVNFFTDSRVVLGYIFNEKRRFFAFVSNRVQRIRRYSCPQQWRYVPSEHNPADWDTRPVPADQLKETTWLSRPVFLLKPEQFTYSTEAFELIDPAQDVEVRPQVETLQQLYSCY